MRSRSERGGTASNGNLTIQGSKSEPDHRFIRKLEDILQELEPLMKQGKAVGFLKSAEGADKLGGIIEDIREAAMNYQVFMSNYLMLAMSDTCIRRPCNKTSTTRALMLL